MSRPVRSLPVVQNWDCHACGTCCRWYHVAISPEERKRIEAQGWDNEPDLRGRPLFVRTGGWFSSGVRLNQKPDGACVFLGPNDRCRIHERYGSAAKPLACRIYPYVLVPAGDHWKLGLRFACPSVARSVGRPLAAHVGPAREYAAALEAAAAPGAVATHPPPLQRGQPTDWKDFARIVSAMSGLLAEADEYLERRWRKVLFVVELCRTTDLSSAPAGELSELLRVLAETAEEEVPDYPDEVPPPGWTGRAVFRPFAGLYARKDSGPDRGPALRSSLGRLVSGWRFARGRGKVPRVHAAIPDTTFAAAESPLPELSDEAESLLTRWARVKLESGQFCGPTNFGLGVWDGIESLALAFTAIMWLARVLASDGRPTDDAVTLAVRIVDDNFGYNPLLKGQARGLRLLARRGELTRLVAWYGKTRAEALPADTGE